MTAVETFKQYNADKARAKALGKDTATGMAKAVTKAAALLVWHSIDLKANVAGVRKGDIR